MLWLADAVSAAPVFGWLLLVAVAIWHTSIAAGLYAGGLIVFLFFLERIKGGMGGLVAGAPWLKRPDGARNCNLWNGGGACGDAVGFPSGHMSMTAYLVVPLFREGVVSWRWVAVLLGLEGWARWFKGCHTVVQIVAGAALGSAVGAALYGQLPGKLFR